MTVDKRQPVSHRVELFDPNLPAEERIGRLEGVVMMLSEMVRGHDESIYELWNQLYGPPRPRPPVDE